jgi:hypothetical protein
MKIGGGRTLQLLVIGFSAVGLVLAGCKTTPPEEGGAPPPEPAGPHAALLKLFPRAQEVADWKPAGAIKVYGPEAQPAEEVEPLSADIGSRALLVQAYDYAKSATAFYKRAEEGEGLTLRIFEMKSPAEAFGLFSVQVRGTQFPLIGLGGGRMAGKTLGFVKDRYFVLLEYTGLREATPVLLLFGHSVEDRVPSRGYLPAILQNFPPGSLDGEHYFLHTYATLATLPFVPNSDPERLERSLGLSRATEMAVLGYPTSRAGVTNYLFAIKYPTEAEATSAGLQYKAYLDASTDPAEKNVAVAAVGVSYLVGTFNAEENSVRDRLADLVANLGG